MNYWRMRMREKWHGFDMFPKCRAKGVAAIHYPPVEDVDLTNLSEDSRPPKWNQLEASQKGSLNNLAWRIRGGDVIYVAKSDPSRIVCAGRVKGPEGNPAYRYLADTPIIDGKRCPWQHVVDVEWGQNFSEDGIPYPKPYAPQPSILKLEKSEIDRIKNLIREGLRNHVSGSRFTSEGETDAAEGSAEQETNLRQLEESAYTRYTAQALRMIDRRHAKLCNEFTQWLLSTCGIGCSVERRNIDLTFRMGKQSVLVEFKIAYHSDPKPAIREALGQILEYNHYPDRKPYNQWILVLDCMPTESDRMFLGTLRQYGIPLSYGWQTPEGFQFSAESPLFAKGKSLR